MRLLSALRGFGRRPPAPTVPDVEGAALLMYRRLQELEVENRYLRAALCANREAVVSDVIANDVATTSMGRDAA